ncbi:MAG TPA: ATP-binding protein, partial [Pseudonocardiaceae bacterium]|nr:ATP-binding protein [Pseudonocardiaceae bacterium]
MISRWPIRIRLTAAFTAMMALVLIGVAIGTLLSFQATYDESLDQTLTTRLHELQTTASANGPQTANTAAQVLDAHTGAILSGSPTLGGHPLLTPTEIATGAAGELRVDHDSTTGLAAPVRILAAPIHRGTAPAAVGVVTASLDGRNAAVADLGEELAVALPLVLIAAAGGAYLLTAASLRPVDRMRARAAAITPTDPDPRLPVPPAVDEIGRLGATLNALLGRLHAALARERQFTADASHELRTPLSMLTTELELALHRPREAAELTVALRSALEETDRLSRLAHDLLLTATDHPQPGNHHAQPIPLRPVLESTLARYHHTADGTVMLDCPDELAVCAETDDLTRTVANLIDNALHHGAAPIILTAYPGHTDTGQPLIHLEVRDHGPGIDPQFLPHALDRFTRADPARTGAGAGLGLAITAALARRNGGTLTAANHPDGGALLTLTLPTPTPPSPPAPAKPPTRL